MQGEGEMRPGPAARAHYCNRNESVAIREGSSGVQHGSFCSKAAG